jgi:Protein of unknown function (DUF1203)
MLIRCCARAGYGEIPAQTRPRLMSVRAFDERHYIVAADVTPGAQLGDLAERVLENRHVSNLLVHHARWGCYVGPIDRAWSRSAAGATLTVHLIRMLWASGTSQFCTVTVIETTQKSTIPARRQPR